MISKNMVLASKCILKTVWQRYEVYIDRIEFSTELSKLVIPFEKIKDVALIETELKGTYQGIIQLNQFVVPRNIEWENYPEYIIVDKDGKYVKAIVYTPESTKAFNQVVEEQLKEYRHQTIIIA